MKTVAQLILLMLSVAASASSPRYALHKLTPFQQGSTMQITDIQQDQLGLLWIGTNGGLLRSSGNKTKGYCFIPHDETSLRCNDITNLTLNHNGRLLVGTDCGLHRYLKSRDHFEYYNSSNAQSVSKTQEDIDGYLWYWTGNGFGRLFHAQGGSPELQYIDVIENLKLRSFDVIDFCITPQFEMWVATSRGLLVLDISAKGRPRLLYRDSRFRVDGDLGNLLSIERDINGQIWLGSRSGLYVFEGKVTNEKPLLATLHFAEFTAVNDLFLASNGDFYFANGNSLAKVTQKNEVKILELNYGFQWPESPILQLKGDRLNQGNFFLVTASNELLYMEKADIGSSLVAYPAKDKVEKLNNWEFPQMIIRVNDDRLLEYRPVLDSTWKNFPNVYKQVTEVIRSQDILMIALKNGGCLVIDAKGTVPILEHISYEIANSATIPSNEVRDIHFLDGMLYIATVEGLVRRELKARKNSVYKETNGLPGRDILSMAVDGRQRLWVLTKKGLAIKSDTTESFFHVIGPYGPVIKPIGLEVDEERIFIKSQNERLELDYEGYAPRREIVPVRIEYLEDASGLGYNLLHRQPDYTLRIPYEDNSIRIDFLTILPVAENDYRYSYELNGQRQENKIIDAAKTFSLNSLSPGAYDLLIQVIDERGQLCGQDQIVFSILPPFWMSIQFFVMAASFILILVALYFFLIYRHEKRRREDIQKVKKKAAADFHDELGSRLAVISLYANMIKKKNTDTQGEVNDYLTKVLDSANELYFAMKDVIWTLKPEAETLTGLLNHLESLTNRTFAPSGIDVEIVRLSSDLPDRKLDPIIVKNVSLITREVMNNAIRHAKSQKFVFSSQVQMDGIKLCWKDDGRGIDAVAEKGEGLENMKMRAHKIGGALTIDSGSWGTKICLSLTF